MTPGARGLPEAVPALALVGPTASGKTAISCAVAPRAGAEIVCIDSMTVYRGMDVGTAKPTASDRARVRHHLLDLCDPGDDFSVAEFQRAARGAIAGIRARGRVPLLVGGSGLYLRAVVDDLEFPPTDPEVRARLAREEPQALLERLRREDPAAGAAIDPANRRRVLRALEVIEITGRPFSSFRRGWDSYDAPLVCAGLSVPPEVLARRIEERTRGMIARGLVEEVADLLARGYREVLAAPRAIGYREAIAHLDGATTLEEMVEETVRATRRLVRRQMTWFRRDPRIRWFDASDMERAADEIGAYYGSRIEGEARACGS